MVIVWIAETEFGSVDYFDQKKATIESTMSKRSVFFGGRRGGQFQTERDVKPPVLLALMLTSFLIHVTRRAPITEVSFLS